MGRLIDNMLKLSRLTQKGMRSERVDLTGIAKSVVQSLRQADPERSVEAVLREGVFVRGDPELLRVLMENLLGNAWKFAGKNPRARIEFGVMEEEEGNAFFIRDNGVGFDMAYAGKLFSAFNRLHAQDEFPGTGIGLATAQRIIHRHGGRIWAEAAPDKGATFYFSVPEVP
jgi:light-regulated signal transduction histidine kinase (bacteriophytochrome)